MNSKRIFACFFVGSFLFSACTTPQSTLPSDSAEAVVVREDSSVAGMEVQPVSDQDSLLTSISTPSDVFRVLNLCKQNLPTSVNISETQALFNDIEKVRIYCRENHSKFTKQESDSIGNLLYQCVQTLEAVE